MACDLKTLPDILFAVKDAEEIKSAIIGGYEEAYEEQYGIPRILAPGDPVRLFLLTVADVVIHQRNLIDYTGKMNLLAFAKDGFLDHIGALVDTWRLPGGAAMTTIRFILSTPLAYRIIIPAGIRMTAGDQVYFATAGAVEVPEGETLAEVGAICLKSGTIGNGYLPGQLKILVDPLPWIKSVENITLTAGGADIEDNESFRERIQLAPEHFSVAGPKGAYRYWAKTAHADIGDVGVFGPEDGNIEPRVEPGQVHIYPLMKNGDIPTQEILDLVYDICNAEDVRPDTDYVFVLEPLVVTCDLSVEYWIDRKNAALATTIRRAVENAVEEWIMWQQGELGRDLNPSELNHRMVAAGAKRTEISLPAFTVLKGNEVAKVENREVRYGGIEDG